MNFLTEVKNRSKAEGMQEFNKFFSFSTFLALLMILPWWSFHESFKSQILRFLKIKRKILILRKLDKS